MAQFRMLLCFGILSFANLPISLVSILFLQLTFFGLSLRAHCVRNYFLAIFFRAQVLSFYKIIISLRSWSLLGETNAQRNIAWSDASHRVARLSKNENLANFTSSQHLEIIGSLWLCFFFSVIFFSDALCNQVRLDAIRSNNENRDNEIDSLPISQRTTKQTPHVIRSCVCVCVCVRSSKQQAFDTSLFLHSFPSLCWMEETLSLKL